MAANRIAPVVTSLTIARLGLNLTQSAVEKQAGLSERYLSRMERGAIQPSLVTLELWAAALNCDITLTRNGRPVTPTARALKDLNRRRAAAALTPDAPILGGTE